MEWLDAVWGIVLTLTSFIVLGGALFLGFSSTFSVAVTKNFIYLIILGVIIIAGLSSFLSPVLLIIIWNIFVLFIFLFDYFHLPSKKDFVIERIAAQKFSLGALNPVTIKVTNNSKKFIHLEITDDYPRQFLSSLTRLSFLIPPYESRSANYYVTPLNRGDYEFGSIWLRISSQWKISQKQIYVNGKANIKVYPNLLAISKYELFARKGRLHEVGLKPSRRVGQGTMFESLREYVPDDDYKKINWKATARRGKLISQEYETEKDQNVIFLIDTARMMVGEFEGLSRLDYALNATLLLSYVALAKGDKVGLILFSNEVESYLPPRRGKEHLSRITEELYNANGRLVEPDYGRAFRYLGFKHRRRSLLILFTNFFSAGQSRALITYMHHLHLVHLPLCVTMKDSALIKKAESFPENSAAVYEKGIAEGLLQEKERTLYQLKRSGSLILDLYPHELSPTLIRTYLDIKLRGRL